jgi:ABC-type lipoprotein export system ATPase subunit
MTLLSLEGVAKTHWRGERELRVLDDVSLHVHPGEFVAIYGQRSAGKTTLLRVAVGFEPPDRGRVRVDGRDLATCSGRDLGLLHRRVIGWVERSGPRSDELTALDYVALPRLGGERRGRARAAAIATLERLGVEACAYDRWSALSDAERGLVALAHALVREPRILVLDDPTGGLDVADREHILELLRRLAHDHGVAILMAAPELPAALRAHRVLSLSGGRLLGPSDPTGAVVDFPTRRRRA